MINTTLSFDLPSSSDQGDQILQGTAAKVRAQVESDALRICNRLWLMSDP
jgi:hypothetical protein